jgi:hypothetical protein
MKSGDRVSSAVGDIPVTDVIKDYFTVSNYIEKVTGDLNISFINFGAF